MNKSSTKLNGSLIFIPCCKDAVFWITWFKLNSGFWATNVGILFTCSLLLLLFDCKLNILSNWFILLLLKLKVCCCVEVWGTLLNISFKSLLIPLFSFIWLELFELLLACFMKENPFFTWDLFSFPLLTFEESFLLIKLKPLGWFWIWGLFWLFVFEFVSLILPLIFSKKEFWLFWLFWLWDPNKSLGKLLFRLFWLLFILLLLFEGTAPNIPSNKLLLLLLTCWFLLLLSSWNTSSNKLIFLVFPLLLFWSPEQNLVN